jgi:ATP-dependent helicase/nuclease subunit B
MEYPKDSTAAAVFFEHVAQRILARQAPPDLRGVVVLLPNHHVAKPLAQALMHVAQLPALLLPQMVTLDDWAQSIALEAPLTADSQRHALLYQQLRKNPWFENADLWAMTRELLQLFDELTHALGELPGDIDAFADAVEQAYAAKQNVALQLEASLVFELWHAMQSGAEIDAARAYQQRLATLAQQADKPLFVLRTSEWDALEQRFLDAYAEHAPVEVIDIREMDAQVKLPVFFAATSFEQEARAATMQVRLWLNEGKRDIAVVAQDRVAARRMRALLERAEVLVADETGWTYATLSVSTVLDRWLAALQNDFYHHDLLDLLKSPFIFTDLSAGQRKAVVYRLEQLLRTHGVVSGLENFAALAAAEAALQPPLARLQEAAALFDRGRPRTLAEWLAALDASLHKLGIAHGLRQDDAGAQLLQALAGWQQELAGDAGRYRFVEWRRWLMQQLDSEIYRDTGIASPVRFTHLAATRWRSFDAVLLIGCDADHLPGNADGGRWFNDAVRSALGLPTRAQHAARQHDDLLALLALNDCVLATWQHDRNGEEGLLSPYLQLLADAAGRDLHDHQLHAYLAAEDAHRVEMNQSAQSAPAVAAERVPATVSISAYNSLVACPYQFYARHLLGLNELDEVPEAIEKRDYGERIHTILQRFHERYAQVSGHSLGEMEGALREISAQVFADLLQHDFAARAWLARWHRSLPAYLEWQADNELQGWHYAAAEQQFERELQGVVLRGRIDRIDSREDGMRVLDYKTQSDQALRYKLADPGEDVQLACYAWAEGAREAAFVSIENGRVNSVVPDQDIVQLAELNARRLEQVMQAMRSGAGLPANGIDAVCNYCEMRGVCRKGEWLNG